MIGWIHGAPRGKRSPPLLVDAGGAGCQMGVRKTFARPGLAGGLR